MNSGNSQKSSGPGYRCVDDIPCGKVPNSTTFATNLDRQVFQAAGKQNPTSQDLQLMRFHVNQRK
jgi:hypothetical protein